jgi:hypothetical protein
MPFFKRRQPEQAGLTFTVGVDGHRVMIGGPVTGCTLIADVDAYIDKVAERAPPTADGRDAVALQNAKMDYVDMVEAMLSVLALTLEELQERGLVSGVEVPPREALPKLDRNLATYDFIQSSYARARQRCEWARQVDLVLHRHGVAVLWPEHEEEQTTPIRF